ncbi:mitochondrial carrier domain-containing protein [Cadophora sp. MPI-SDFR-AT-0126]|nr:mitochondrial carrier domain-containing protein [Leotiomycetes sp. MPI-SDFR-AT-0126]
MSFSQYNSQLDAFSSYHKVQEESSSPLQGPALPALGHALAGSTGTAIANLAIYPLDLVITRLQVQRSLRKSSTTADEGEYKGVLDAFEQIYNKEGGLSAFYGGVLQDTGKSIADSFLFFLFYNYLRTSRLQKKGLNATALPALDELGVGAFAGALSKLFTTPISNIVTRKQTASMIAARSSSTRTEPTVSDIASQIRSEKGLQGFWSGYSASLVLTLNPSITFFLYETFKRTLLPRSQRDDPGARITFLMAAFSKAIASSITYPFALAKARAQISSKPPVDKESAEIVMEEVEKSRNRTDAEKAGRDAKKLAKGSTVFATILRIYRTEGPAALYEGVWGEIFKGFLTHGTTMIIKEQIHKLIIQAYYMILKALNKYPSPSELAKQASDAVQDAGEKAGQYVANATGKGGELLKDGYENVAERVGITTERAGVVANNATEAAKTANDFSAKEAGNLLGNAQEMLGGKIEEAGHALKNSEVKQVKKDE